MPPTKRETSPDLGIVVDKIGRPYQPGDVITGRVVRQAHVVCPMAIIEVWLLGRAKVKLGITRSNGQGAQTTYYRGRFNFFDKAPTRVQAGPIHIPPGGATETWEFALEIPSTMSPRAVLSEHKDATRGSFLPLDTESITSCPLPTSFFAKGRHQNRHYETYVEYHIEASLALQGSQGKLITASQPIEVRAQPSSSPLATFNLKSQPQIGSVSTFRLVPGMEDVNLTFKQKTQKLFHSSKVPSLGFKLQVDTPTVIQLDHSVPVPVVVRIVPDRTRTTDILHDAPQTALLTSLELIVKARTYVSANGYRDTYDTDAAVKHRITLPFHAITTGPIVTNMDEPKGGHEDPPPYKEKGTPGQPQDIKGHNPISSQDEVAIVSESFKATETSTPADSKTDPSSSLEQASTVKGSTAKALLLPINWGPNLSNCTPLDVGTLMDLHIYAHRVTVLGNRSLRTEVGGIYPDFTTYCAKHVHSLKWKMTLVIAGEDVAFEAEHPLSVLGPSAV